MTLKNEFEVSEMRNYVSKDDFKCICLDVNTLVMLVPLYPSFHSLFDINSSYQFTIAGKLTTSKIKARAYF